MLKQNIIPVAVGGFYDSFRFSRPFAHTLTYMRQYLLTLAVVYALQDVVVVVDIDYGNVGALVVVFCLNFVFGCLVYKVNVYGNLILVARRG